MKFSTQWPTESGYYWFIDTEYPSPQIGFIQQDILWYGDTTYRQASCQSGRPGIRIGDCIVPPACTEVEIVELCPGCGEEIDPDICWCGEYVKDHGYFDNHSAVPMGCNCHRSES